LYCSYLGNPVILATNQALQEENINQGKQAFLNINIVTMVTPLDNTI